MPGSPGARPASPGDIEIRRVGPVDVELRDDGAMSHSAAAGSASRSTSRHQAQNALTALTAYDGARAAARSAAESAATCELSRWRGEELALPGGGFVDQRRLQREPDLDARPRSSHLAERGGAGARLAILGGMAELGEHAERHHAEIGELRGRARTSR